MAWAAVCLWMASAALPVVAARAQTAGLIWPAEPLILTTGAAGFTTSVTVANPTDSDMQVRAAPGGSQPGQNQCAVGLTAEAGTVPARRGKAVVITVAAVAGPCADPADGAHAVSLTASDDRSAPEMVTLAIRKAAAPAEAPKATGLVWPDKPVFLQRRDGKLTGSFTVVNPTKETINVIPPSFVGCQQNDPSTAAAEMVRPEQPATITLSGPAADCTALATRDLVATAAAATVDGSKRDAQKLTLQAEVDWGRFGHMIRVCLLAGFSIAVGVSLIPREAKKTGLWDPLLIDSSSPTSWLTSVATVGSLLTTLVSTSGLVKGLFGADSIPQTTLIVGAGAVSLALVGLAGLVTGIPSRMRTIEGKRQGCPMIIQFAVGAGISAAAAAFQIWAVRTALRRLDRPVIGGVADGVAVVATVALALYLAWSVHWYINRYAEMETPEPPAVKPSEELVSAIAAGLLPLYTSSEPVPPEDQRRVTLIGAAQAAAADAKRAATAIAASAASSSAEGTESQPPPVDRGRPITPIRFTRKLI